MGPTPGLETLSALMLGSLPVVSLPSFVFSHSDAFAKLLESGDLSMSSIKVDGINMSFQNLLAKICFYHHFSGKGFDGTCWQHSLCSHVVLPLLPPGPRGPHACLLCCSCGACGLLRLPVQPIHPGPPHLPPGEEGEPHEGSLPAPCHHAPHATVSPPCSPCRFSYATRG